MTQWKIAIKRPSQVHMETFHLLRIIMIQINVELKRKKPVNIQSQYRYKSRSPRGPDEVLKSKGSLPVWRSGSNLDFHRVTFWNVDGLRREYVDFHSMEPKTNCKMHASVKTLHDNRHVKLSLIQFISFNLVKKLNRKVGLRYRKLLN